MRSVAVLAAVAAAAAQFAFAAPAQPQAAKTNNLQDVPMIFDADSGILYANMPEKRDAPEMYYDSGTNALYAVSNTKRELNERAWGAIVKAIAGGVASGAATGIFHKIFGREELQHFQREVGQPQLSSRELHERAWGAVIRFIGGAALSAIFNHKRDLNNLKGLNLEELLSARAIDNLE